VTTVSGNGVAELEIPSLLEIGRRAAMQAEREAIERVLAQTRWNRRQAARILRISYKALLNKLKVIEEHTKGQVDS
jgi:DNA-binding NtrC family response regulator